MVDVGQISPNDPRLLRCGFAKLQFLGKSQGDDGFEFFIRKYETLLGRRSSSAQADVVLGDNMNTSRKHASITFNFEKGVFELTVLGKNGVSIDGVLFTPNSSPAPLASKVLLAMGDREFYFLLPKLPGKPRVRAKAPKKAAGQDAPTAAGRERFDMNQEPPPEPQQQQQQSQQHVEVQPQPQREAQAQPQPQLIVVQQQQQSEQQGGSGQQQQPLHGSGAPFGGVQAEQITTPAEASLLPAQPTLQQLAGSSQPAEQPAQQMGQQQVLQQQFHPLASAGPDAMDAAQQQALLQHLQWQQMQHWQNGGLGGLPAFQQQQQQQQQQVAAGSTLPSAAASAPQGIGFQSPGPANSLDAQQQQALLQQLQAAQQRQQQAALLQQLQASQQQLLQQHQQQLQQPQQQLAASVAQLAPQFQAQQGAAAGLPGASFSAPAPQQRPPDQL